VLSLILSKYCQSLWRIESKVTNSSKYRSASVKFWDRYGDSKYKKLKLRLFNQYSLSNLDKIGYNIQESIVSFARLPLGHSFDFICLAPWGGLDSVIEEFEEDVTISSEEEDESHIQRVCS